MEGRVARIAIAPVKALHVVEKDEVDLEFTGVTGDRRFWMVDADGRLVNDKRHPQLLRVRVEWDEAPRKLGLEFPDGGHVASLTRARLYTTDYQTLPGNGTAALELTPQISG